MKKELLELFEKHKLGFIPYSDDEARIYNNAVWFFEKRNILYRLGSKLHLTGKGKANLDKMLAFEGDLENYPFL